VIISYLKISSGFVNARTRSDYVVHLLLFPSTSEFKENTMTTLEGDMVVSTSGESSICVACQDTDWMVDLGDPFMFFQEGISLHPISPVTMVL